jgi:Holliday junction resolvase RusA-like endonuclease
MLSFYLDINPEPWAIGPVSVGRGAGGKMYPVVGRNQQLNAYQQAVKEAMLEQSQVSHEPTKDVKWQLHFGFWRQRADYTTPQARTHRKHEADVTNMQKATEDALQGILFTNDKDVKYVSSFEFEQSGITVPGIAIMAALLEEPLNSVVPYLLTIRNNWTAFHGQN